MTPRLLLVNSQICHEYMWRQPLLSSHVWDPPGEEEEEEEGSKDLHSDDEPLGGPHLLTNLIHSCS